MKIKNIEIKWDGVEIGNIYYFYWWNWLKKEYRHWGREEYWYDGPHVSFGLWFVNLSWSTPWTKMKKENYPQI